MTGIRDVLTRVTSDQRITSAEWKEQLAPALEGAPKKASDDARALLDAYVDAFEVAADVRTSMRSFLSTAGYTVPQMNPPGMTAEERALWKDRAIAGNITETDATFSRLAEAVGGGTTVPIAVVDSGFEISHPAFAGKLWTNAKETRGNGIDDDGNGFVDDVCGWDFADNDADVKGGEHGTHVAGIASRSTD
ncbi:MAG: S8 family serine peptidase, partial [Myxococcaceae bacterium]